MKIVEFSLSRRVTVMMCTIAMTLFGIVGFTRLPVNLMPELSYPSLTVQTQLDGAAPPEVEALLTRSIEEAVGVVAGVTRMSSVSKPGLSQVTLELDWGRDMDFAAIDVRQKLDLLRMPDEATRPTILRFDPSSDPIIRLYLTGDVPLERLRYIAEEVVKKDLESTDGVAAIRVYGGLEEEIEVLIDEGRLTAMGLDAQLVRDQLAKANLDQAGGSLYEAEARYLVRSANEFTSLEDIRETVLTSVDGRQVRVGDVATVVRGSKQREVISRFQGKEAVELALYKEGDANTVTVARSVAQRLENTRKELDEGVEIATGADQSRFISASIREVLLNAGIGGIAAFLVLLLFLKDLRSTLVIAVSIPISIVATFFLMYRTGTTLNIMSLGGLALGVGMLVDSAIVVLESIVARREAGDSKDQAALRGTSEVGQAVIASTLTTVAVFVPVVFLEGLAAQLFRDQALTVSFSLLAAMVVSLTLIPMLSAGKRQRPGIEETVAGGKSLPKRLSFLGSIGRGLVVVLSMPFRLIEMLFKPLFWLVETFMAGLDATYARVLKGALAARPIVILVAIALFAISMQNAKKLGVDLIPPFAQGEFSFKVELPEGTPLAVTDRTLNELAADLDGEEAIEAWSVISGNSGLTTGSSGAEGENTGRIQVRLLPGTAPEVENRVVSGLRSAINSSDQVANFDLERPTFFSFRTPIEVEVFSDDLATLNESAQRIADELSSIDGLVDVRSSVQLGNPEVRVEFDRGALARLGLDLGVVASTVRTKLQGEVPTRFSEADREIDIRVRAISHGDAQVSDLDSLIIGQREGRPIYLSTVATIETAFGATEIRRIGQRRAAVVSGNLSDRDMGAVAADVRAALSEMALPASISAALSGQEEEMQRSFSSLALGMALAIFLVYLVMASQFESFLHPLVIIFTVPLGAIGVIWSLALTGTTLNVVAIIGAVMLAGIVVNNAIVLVDAVNQRRREGVTKLDALMQAGRSRLRPILMTTLTTIVGLAPMAMGFGEGAELRAPLAITVIGGLAVATLLTLVVIPVVYSYADREPLTVKAEEKEPNGALGATR